MIQLTILVISAFLAFVLLIVGSRMAIKEVQAHVEEVKEKTEEEDIGKREVKERLNFLREYSIKMESMLNQRQISEEEYMREMAWVDVELDKMEGGNKDDQYQ